MENLDAITSIIIAICFSACLVAVAIGALLELKKTKIGTIECGYIETDHGYQPMIIPHFDIPFDDLKHTHNGMFKIKFRGEIPADELPGKLVTVTKGDGDEEV